jgi:hypothetical protein
MKSPDGLLGDLERYAILANAVKSLSEEDLKSFCEQVGLEHGSEEFERLLRLGERFRRWQTEFDSEWAGVAFMHIASVPDAEFDSMTEDAAAIMKLLGQCEGYAGVARPRLLN